MPTKKKAENQPTPAEGLLEHAAKTIGSALGTIVAKAGIAHAEEPPKRGRLVKKPKKGLPRREKKQAKKAAAKKNPANRVPNAR